MREAFGGEFMLRVMLVVIVIFIAFGAISLNYAKAFKIKNRVISYIEENDITDFNTLFTSGDKSKLNELDKILDSYHYGVFCEGGVEGNITKPADPAPRYCYHGIIIEEQPDKITDNDKSTEVIHYNVSTFVSWNLTFMNRILMLSGKNPNADDVINGSWEITGDARVVKRLPYSAKENGYQDSSDDDINYNPGSNYTNKPEDNPGANVNNNSSSNPGANSTSPKPSSSIDNKLDKKDNNGITTYYYGSHDYYPEKDVIMPPTKASFKPTAQEYCKNRNQNYYNHTVQSVLIGDRTHVTIYIYCKEKGD